jgi:hypothetical protein
MKQFKNFAAILALAFGLMLTQSSCKDECKNVDCGTNGTCEEGVCICDAGYVGDNCQTEERAKFLGSYAFSENCTTGQDTYTVTITADGADVQKIRIANIYDAGITVVASVSGSSLTIASQAFGQATISGSGTISGTSLTLTYTVTAGGGTDSCTGTGTR